MLDNLRGLKVVYDKDYFNKQTFEEYLVDPLGAKLIDAWAASDSAVQENVKAQGRLGMKMSKVAEGSIVKLDLESPSKKRQE